MADVRERWLSKRALSLHVAVLVVVPGCAVAAWWQVTRAEDGNQLSYLYSVMWPVFGLLGLWFWWMLIHTDYETVGMKGLRRQQAAVQNDAAPQGRGRLDLVRRHRHRGPRGPALEDDPELAAYNARLAGLAANGAKTWRNRESVVVRRAP